MITEELLRSVFERFGKVEDATIKKTKIDPVRLRSYNPYVGLFSCYLWRDYMFVHGCVFLSGCSVCCSAWAVCAATDPRRALFSCILSPSILYHDTEHTYTYTYTHTTYTHLPHFTGNAASRRLRVCPLRGG